MDCGYCGKDAGEAPPRIIELDGKTVVPACKECAYKEVGKRA